ncbi:hypothetical protein COU60_01700 [Candidatus Pacearchaeota archaeon CG10_big_fil_rev_8_21_14_0_10_34_76]|nr:MAG: hypothetical protein COU60_01700 [Candidatus Pacearchaeota archaeon CG10_big_fil_rev_8_21_14_0_10_34_76]
MAVYKRNYVKKVNKRNWFSNLSLTNSLIILNVVTYFISLLILTIYGEKFFLDNIALSPMLVLSGQTIWTFLTSMFSHVMFFHLFANMFSLFFVGNFVEKIIGRKRMLWFYIIAGIVGGAFFVIGGILFNNDIPGIGASGAIFGLVGILAVLIPYSRIYLIAGPLIVLLIQAILSQVLSSSILATFNFIFNILVIVMIFAIFSWNPSIRKLAVPIQLPMWLLPIVAIVPLIILGYFVSLPISNSAHFGGLVVGLAYGFYLRKRYNKKVKMLRRMYK